MLKKFRDFPKKKKKKEHLLAMNGGFMVEEWEFWKYCLSLADGRVSRGVNS